MPHATEHIHWSHTCLVNVPHGHDDLCQVAKHFFSRGSEVRIHHGHDDAYGTGSPTRSAIRDASTSEIISTGWQPRMRAAVARSALHFAPSPTFAPAL